MSQSAYAIIRKKEEQQFKTISCHFEFISLLSMLGSHCDHIINISIFPYYNYMALKYSL